MVKSILNMAHTLGAYIAKGQRGFYMFSIEEDDDDIFLLKNIPTPYSNDEDRIPTSPCIKITITRNPNTGTMNFLKHGDTCGLGKQLERGENGTIDMALTALALASDLYNIRQFEFKDKSSFICNGRKINLRLYSLFTKGETWYSRHFPNVRAREDSGQYFMGQYRTKVLQKVTREDGLALSEALRKSDIDEWSMNKHLRVVAWSVALGETWEQMFAKVYSCSFFTNGVLVEILSSLGLVSVSDFTLAMYPSHVRRHLHDYEQVYKNRNREQRDEDDIWR